MSSAQAGWCSRFATMCRQMWMPASIVSGFRCLSFPRLHRIGVVVSHTHQLLLRQALVWPLFVILCSCTWHVLPRLSLCCGSKLIVAAGPKGNRFKDYQPQHAQRTQCRHASPALPNRACCKQRRELHIPAMLPLPPTTAFHHHQAPPLLPPRPSPAPCACRRYLPRPQGPQSAASSRQSSPLRASVVVASAVATVTVKVVCGPLSPSMRTMQGICRACCAPQWNTHAAHSTVGSASTPCSTW